LWDFDPYRRRFLACTTLDSSRKYRVSRGDVGRSRNTSANEPLLWQGRPLFRCCFRGKKKDDQERCAYFFAHDIFPQCKTVVGEITYGQDGEWATPRAVFTQIRNDLGQFRNASKKKVEVE
jgi:hypothetical protein